MWSIKNKNTIREDGVFRLPEFILLVIKVGIIAGLAAAFSSPAIFIIIIIAPRFKIIVGTKIIVPIPGTVKFLRSSGFTILFAIAVFGGRYFHQINRIFSF